MGVIWQATIIGSTGLPTAGASITVKNESDSSLASIFSDIDCTAVKDNPFLSDSNGYAFFYTEGGRFKITASKGGYETTWRNILLGDYAETSYVDAGVLDAKAYTDEEVYDVNGAVVALGVDVELNKEIWKDQDGVDHRLWISELEPDDEYDGEDGDIWFKIEAES